MLWIGERTRELDGAHVEFLRGVNNPIGCKLGPDADAKDVLTLCETLNPEKVPGRLTLISRMGSETVSEKLPLILETVQEAGHPVVWVCDPMHGNTYKLKSGYKTRHFDTIVKEIEAFFNIHNELKTIPAGIHLEFTGEHVTECLGGTDNIIDNDLENQYDTACDPRLNVNQSLELAYRITKLLIKNKENFNV